MFDFLSRLRTSCEEQKYHQNYYHSDNSVTTAGTTLTVGPLVYRGRELDYVSLVPLLIPESFATALD